IDVRRDRLDARARAAADDADARRRRNRELAAEALVRAALGRIGARAALEREPSGRVVGRVAQMPKDTQVPALRHRALERDAASLQERMKAHRAEADGSLPPRRVNRVTHLCRRTLDEVLEYVVEKAHQIVDEARIVAPLVPRLEIDRRQAAHGGADLADVIAAGRQQNLAAQVRLAHGEPELALMGRQMPVRRVDEQQIRLAGLQARLENFLPQLPGRNGLDRRAGRGALQRERTVIAHGFHELVRDRDAVVQVEALAVEVAGRLTDLDELIDLRMMHVEIDGG